MVLLSGLSVPFTTIWSMIPFIRSSQKTCRALWVCRCPNGPPGRPGGQCEMAREAPLISQAQEKPLTRKLLKYCFYEKQYAAPQATEKALILSKGLQGKEIRGTLPKKQIN